MLIRWLPKALNLILIISILVSCSPSNQSPGSTPNTQTNGTWTPLSAEEMKAVSALVPEDPKEGAIALVKIVHGDDEALARAAMGELLRRSGLPLVSIYGPVIALPDILILGDAPVYVELIDGLTEATRRKNFYTPIDLAELLNAIGFSDEVLPEEVLMEAFGLWGKTENAPDESVVASAAVRALSNQRGEVLYAGADPGNVQIDPLQTLLILAHVSSRNWVNNQAKEPTTFMDNFEGVQVVHAQGEACEALSNTFGSLFSGGKTGIKGLEWLDEFNMDTTKNIITSVIEAGVELRKGAEAAARLAKAMTGYEILNTLMSTFLLLQGAQIDITSDKDLIHLHHGSDHANSHAKFVATASFNSNMSETEIKCYGLLGLKIPNNKTMEDFGIKWRINEPKGSRQLVAPISKDSGKLDSRGSTGPPLGPTRQSNLEIYAAREKPPEVGEIIKARVSIVASLDISNFLFKLSDIWSLANPGAFAISKSFEIVMDMIKRAGLPNAQKTITVERHGKDIYIGHAIRNINALYVDVPINVIVWTCDGVEGQWHSWTSFKVDEHLLKEIWTLGFGKLGYDFNKIPYGYKEYEEWNFRINPLGVNILNLFTEMQLSGILELDQVPEAGGHIDGVIGELEVLLAGHSFAEADELGGSAFKIPIKGIDEFDQCPASKIVMDNE